MSDIKLASSQLPQKKKLIKKKKRKPKSFFFFSYPACFRPAIVHITRPRKPVSRLYREEEEASVPHPQKSAHRWIVLRLKNKKKEQVFFLLHSPPHKTNRLFCSDTGSWSCCGQGLFPFWKEPRESVLYNNNNNNTGGRGANQHRKRNTKQMDKEVGDAEKASDA